MQEGLKGTSSPTPVSDRPNTMLELFLGVFNESNSSLQNLTDRLESISEKLNATVSVPESPNKISEPPRIATSGTLAMIEDYLKTYEYIIKRNRMLIEKLESIL